MEAAAQGGFFLVITLSDLKGDAFIFCRPSYCEDLAYNIEVRSSTLKGC